MGLQPGLGLQAFRDAVVQERLWEFSFESQRWFDPVRTGKLVETLSAPPYSRSVQPHNTLFSIPEEEIAFDEAITSADQNPGY